MPYDEFVEIVDKAFEEWGSQDPVWVKPGSPGTLNPNTGIYTGATASTNVPIKAIFKPVSLFYVDGKNVLAGDVEIKMSPKDLATIPQIGDKIKRGSVTFTVINPKHIQPGDTPLLLVYHARLD